MSQPLSSANGTIRGWLRMLPRVTNLCEQRQYFSMPEKDKPVTPFIILYRIGGTGDIFGQDYPQMILETWGSNLAEAEDLGLVVASEINANPFNPVDVPGFGRVCDASTNLGPIPSGASGGYKRYRIDAAFHLRSSQ